MAEKRGRKGKKKKGETIGYIIHTPNLEIVLENVAKKTSVIIFLSICSLIWSSPTSSDGVIGHAYWFISRDNSVCVWDIIYCPEIQSKYNYYTNIY
jgi:hypothetical protein